MRFQKEGTPSEYVNLAGDTQKGFDESGKLPDRLQRYAFARERALINLSHIHDKLEKFDSDLPSFVGYDRSISRLNPFIFHLQKIRPRLRECGDYLKFHHYYTVGKVRLQGANFCMCHLLCPLCAIRRGSKSLESYIQRFEIIRNENPHLSLSMLTLTVKNGDDLGERFKHLKKSLKTMLEWRRKTLSGKAGYHSQFAKIAGLVGSIEITKDGALDGSASGWHPHAHIMVLHSECFDYVALQAEWLKITGDSHVLNVSAAQHPDDPAQDFLEVFKYALKFSDLTPEQNLEAYEVMRGKNLLFSGGLFRGVVVPVDLTDTPLDDLPYIALFYRYLPQSGYNLVEVTDSEVCKPGK